MNWQSRATELDGLVEPTNWSDGEDRGTRLTSLDRQSRWVRYEAVIRRNDRLVQHG